MTYILISNSSNNNVRNFNNPFYRPSPTELYNHNKNYVCTDRRIFFLHVFHFPSTYVLFQLWHFVAFILFFDKRTGKTVFFDFRSGYAVHHEKCVLWLFGSLGPASAVSVSHCLLVVCGWLAHTHVDYYSNLRRNCLLALPRGNILTVFALSTSKSYFVFGLLLRSWFESRLWNSNFSLHSPAAA